MLWVCVMKPEEAAVGLQVVYFEIDSLLPELPVFAFMADRKYHVKTCKFRGQISQGLALPATFFKEQLDKAGTLLQLYLSPLPSPPLPHPAPLSKYSSKGPLFQ